MEIVGVPYGGVGWWVHMRKEDWENLAAIAKALAGWVEPTSDQEEKADKWALLSGWLQGVAAAMQGEDIEEVAITRHVEYSITMKGGEVRTST